MVKIESEKKYTWQTRVYTTRIFTIGRVTQFLLKLDVSGLFLSSRRCICVYTRARARTSADLILL